MAQTKYQIRRSKERGYAHHGWLESYHTFSFADYHDEENMHFRVLRVINEDFIEGGMGFGMHGHRDMEIITYVIDGALQHKDSMGNTEIVRPGEVQRMSAGTGVRHSEFNPLPDTRTHLLQIWILPDHDGYTPSYEQKSFTDELNLGSLRLVASHRGEHGSVSLNQDMKLYAGRYAEAREEKLLLPAHRHLWLQVVKGDVKFLTEKLQSGDGLAVMGEPQAQELGLALSAGSEILVFDLP